MQYPALPETFTSQILKALNLRQFSIVCQQFGFTQVWKRLGWDDFLQFWEQERDAPNETFGEFLRRVGVKV